MAAAHVGRRHGSWRIVNHEALNRLLWSEKAGRQGSGNPLPPKIAALLREAWWLVLVAVALYLAARPRHLPPRRSRAGRTAARGAPIANARRRGRRLDRRRAALSLRAVGLLVGRALRRARRPGASGASRTWRAATGARSPSRSPASSSCCSRAAALEAMRLHSLQATLPLAPGRRARRGARARSSRSAFGFTGGTLILLLAFAAGLSLFTGLSWLRSLERARRWARVRASRFVLAQVDERAATARRASRRAIERDEKVEESRRRSSRTTSRSASSRRAVEIPKSERVGAREAGAALRRTCPIRRCRRSRCSTTPDTHIERHVARRRSNSPRA